jgi:actin-related protein
MSSSKCVVFEFSSEILCVGFSGEHVPRLLTQSSVMCLDNEAVLRETIRKIFIDILLVKPKDYSVLLIENIFIKSETRDQLINILFREFQVCIAHMLSCGILTFVFR